MSAHPDPSPDAAREAELADRARTDPEAFGELYDRLAPQIYRFVYSRLRHRETAEDVTADVFYKALRAIDSYRPGQAPFRVWLYRIANNAVIDQLRGRRPAASLSEVGDRAAPDSPVDEQVVRRSEVERVWAALDGLNDAQRLAVSLKLGQDMHTADIAACMRRSEGAVKLLVHRGIAGIRRSLEVAEGARP